MKDIDRKEILGNIPKEVLKPLIESLNYLLKSQAQHYIEWCDRPWLKPEDHIYHDAEIAFNYFYNEDLVSSQKELFEEDES
tara:strand:+ start:184 stop:426 length:243 start_codon:yes stop_codon:yes gene_type:complete